MNVRWAKIVKNVAEAEKAVSFGFDCVQINIGYIMGFNKRQFINQKNYLVNSGLSFEVFYDPLPSDVVVTEEGFNIYAWTEYLKKAISRITQLGCKKLIWSNGKARMLPLEGDIIGAKEQILQFLFILCDICDNYNITVLLEPLGVKHTNFLNSMEEINNFLPLIGKNNIASILNLREMKEIGIEPADIGTYRKIIKHVLLQNPITTNNKHLCPQKNDGFDYRPFLQALIKIDYTGIITLPEDANKSGLTFCQNLLDELQ